MYIENFNKIYGQVIYTSDTIFEFVKDKMLDNVDETYTVRLNPLSGTTKHGFTLVITQLKNLIKCGIYIDGNFNALEIFDINRKNLKSIDEFKRLIAEKIQEHE